MTALRSIAHELCLNLEEQTRVWRRLLDLSHAQLAALEVQDVHSVHAILQEVEIAMLDRSRTEVRRGVLLAQAGALLEIAPDQVTRDIIAEHCDAPLGQALAVAAEELRALVVELDAVVGRNTAMLEQELAIIEVLVRGATIDTSAQKTYGKHGMQQEAPRLRLLDAQV
ncbi:MAG: hypothetical protein JWM98_1555 [Thermoleophilia bacterium]|nr:hypothetical protein [Thermoleophilia bacterium]